MNSLTRASDKPSLLLTVSVWLGLGLGAVAFGFLAATSNPKLIAVSVGIMLGGMLLLAPKMNLWVVIAVGLGAGSLITLAGPMASKAELGIVLIAQMLFIPFLLNFLSRPRLPLFIWLYVGFVVLSVISSIIYWDGAGVFLSGVKRYYPALGLMLALAVMPMSPRDHRLLRKIFLWLAVLQVPFVLYEAFVLVPIRRALMGPNAGSQVTDVIAGTFGANLRGGSPGAEMVAFVLIMSAFAWARWREGLLSKSKLILFLSAMLPCVALGEMKFMVVLFPMLAMVLYREQIMANPARLIPGVVTIGLITVAFVYLYFGYFSESTIDKGWEDMLRYNVADQGYGNEVLNRTTALIFWWQHQGSHDPVGFLFGHGISSSYWVPDPGGSSGIIGARFPSYGVNLTTASGLLWDTGVVGTALYIGIFVFAFIQAIRHYSKEKDPEVRSALLAIQAALALFLAYVPYAGSLLYLFTFQIVIACVLGYLAQILMYPEAVRASAQP